MPRRPSATRPGLLLALASDYSLALTISCALRTTGCASDLQVIKIIFATMQLR